MWKSLHRSFFLTLITGFLFLFLAACSTSGGSPTSTSTPAATPTPTPANITPYTVSGHSDEITDVAWSPDGKLIGIVQQR
jgi:WD40 repeat protein